MPLELIVSDLLVPVELEGPAERLKAAAGRLGLPEASIEVVKILFRELVIADPEQFYYRFTLAVRPPAGYANENKLPLYIPGPAVGRGAVSSGQRPVIIGFGPAGMFAALELLEYGLKPRIYERGRSLTERHLDVQRFIRCRELSEESNIQFGEGGTGAYSDGKLFSRINNTSYASRVLDTFIKFGAPAEIGYVAKPHLGTDVLRRIVVNIRNYILDRGGEIHFGSRMTDILVSRGSASGVVINDSAEVPASSVYLAIGNSARDTFSLLHEKGVAMEARAVSVGARVEHPADTINMIRYGSKYRDFRSLGAATYSFNHTDRAIGRGAYTFCMCPGGEIVNASSREGLLALNGMSYAARGSEYSNSAIAVTCSPEDYGDGHPLAGIKFQERIESAAFLAGGGDWRAPAQMLADFLDSRSSPALQANSYKMGVAPADLGALFPSFVGAALRAAFGRWRRECPLFVGGDAILMGPETRTSSPVRMKRKDDFESVNIRNLYPIGEGSGYSGGITSSAVDALKAVEAAQRGATAPPTEGPR